VCGRFDRIRVHDLWHFEPRLLRKILAFDLFVDLSIERGFKPLDLHNFVM
jgi:hypothetical protein